MEIKCKLIVLTVLSCFLISVSCTRSKDNIYENVYGNMCFRRLNATHQTGCSSGSKSIGNIGVLHLIKDQKDIEFLLTNPPAPPYAAILKPQHFTRENIIKLRDSEFVSALVLINDTTGMTEFSQESKCPNEFFKHAQQPTCDVTKPETTWNPFGSGLLQENFEIPIIFLSNQNESAKVIKCFNDFNRGKSIGSLCAIEVNAFMSAAGNSEICMRRSELFKLLNQVHYCDPMQGKNIYATLFPRETVEPENRTVDESEKIILVSARFDTTSGFDGVGLGAMDSLVSVATLVTAAHYLRKIVEIKKDYNVMFMLFNGESYDYIGSQRFVYDLQKGDKFPSLMTHTRPLNLDNIALVIDLGTLDTFNDLKLFQIKEVELGKKFLDAAQKFNEKFKLNVRITQQTTFNIPPVSAQTFLRENSSFPAVVLATEKPQNKFYHSVFDDASNLGFVYRNTSQDFDVLPGLSDDFNSSTVQSKIRNVATVLALGIYEVIEGKEFDKTQIASAVFVDEFLYCYLVATKCRLFQATFDFPGSFRGNDFPPTRYVSVQASVTLEATGWAHRVFGFVLSQKVPNMSKENCTDLPLSWIPGSNGVGECRLTTQNFSLALSPAFEEPGYDFKSNKYSTWTESTWNELSARIFLRPSATHESLTFSIGFVVMILSFVAVYLVNSKADVLFSDAAVEHVSLPAQC